MRKLSKWAAKAPRALTARLVEGFEARRAPDVARITALEAKVAGLERLVADQGVHLEQVAWLSERYGRVPPIPPKHLQVRVSGDYYGKFFLHGLHMLGDIDKALAKEKRALSSFERILDFGCGCGRFLIPLRFRVDPARLHGCDIDEEAIGWFRSRYPELGGLHVVPHMPKTAFDDESFDFVYGVSVFTHLPEDMQHAWLGELRRLTKPGAYLVLTTHGRKFLGQMPTKYHPTFEERGFFYLDEAGETNGLPTFYKGAYHLHTYIEREWGKYFRVVSMIEKGLGSHQDLILLRRE